MKITWYSACLLFYCYYFGLEPTVRKDTWMRMTSVTAMIIFFEYGFLKVTWSQLSSNSLLNNYEAHWQQHFERYPTVLYFTDMDQHACKIFHQDFGKHHWNENRWKCLEKDQLRKNPRVLLEVHCTKVKSTCHLFYTLLFFSNLDFKFKIVLIGIFLTISTSIYLLFCLLIKGNKSVYIANRTYRFCWQYAVILVWKTWSVFKSVKSQRHWNINNLGNSVFFK